jgi:hypothetical protein
MLLRQCLEELPVFLDAQVPVEIGSSPGVGKSEGIDQLVTQLSNREFARSSLRPRPPSTCSDT